MYQNPHKKVSLPQTISESKIIKEENEEIKKPSIKAESSSPVSDSKSQHQSYDNPILTNNKESNEIKPEIISNNFVIDTQIEETSNTTFYIESPSKVIQIQNRLNKPSIETKSFAIPIQESIPALEETKTLKSTNSTSIEKPKDILVTNKMESLLTMFDKEPQKEIQEVNLPMKVRAEATLIESYLKHEVNPLFEEANNQNLNVSSIEVNKEKRNFESMLEKHERIGSFKMPNQMHLDDLPKDKKEFVHYQSSEIELRNEKPIFQKRMSVSHKTPKSFIE